MQNTLYINTVDSDNHAHAYRLPLTDTIPEGHEITSVRPAGQFPVTALLSADSLAALATVGIRKGIQFRK